MRVLITGGTGLIGKAAAERLIQKGWDVRVIDLVPTFDMPGVEYAQCDILNYADLLQQTKGCDAVIHMAAIRSPYLAPGHTVFQVNAAGTFNVFEAAAACGIKRVVQASSINAIGAFYNTGEIHPPYFPIDEDVPRITTDPYSFSKQVIEDMGEYYWRRDGISSVAMRFPGVYSSEYLTSDAYLQRRETMRKLLDELASKPESEQRDMIAAVQQRVLEYRTQRPFEFRPEQSANMMSGLYDDPLFGMYISERFNFWAFVDKRDAAQSLEKGVTAAYEGAHPLFINDSCNALLYDSKTLVRLFFPEVTDFKTALSGSEALLNINRARQLIGFEPEYSVQNST